MELPSKDHRFATPPHMLLPWNSQWIRAIEAAYEMIANDVSSKELVQGLPELPKEKPDTKFIVEHRGKLGLLGLMGLIGFLLSFYYG